MNEGASTEIPQLKGDVLPDSRLKTIHTPRGMMQGPGGMWVPIFCANCGKDGGHCPEENMNFLFYLCNNCFEKLGPVTNLMFMPDELFYQKLKEEQMATYGRYLTPAEIAQVVEADASPLATLLKSRR